MLSMAMKKVMSIYGNKKPGVKKKKSDLLSIYLSVFTGFEKRSDAG